MSSYHYIMSSEDEQFIEIFTSFIERFTQGMEAFQFRGNHIGTGIFLLNFIGKHPYCTMSDVIAFLKLIPNNSDFVFYKITIKFI